MCECIVAYIYLKTNNLGVISVNIVEIGALVDGSRAMFSTFVRRGCGTHFDDAYVHYIPREELLSGPCFKKLLNHEDRAGLALSYSEL